MTAGLVFKAASQKHYTEHSAVIERDSVPTCALEYGAEVT